MPSAPFVPLWSCLWSPLLRLGTPWTLFGSLWVTLVSLVGACWEMLNGKSDERPLLPPGGHVTPVANAQATANGIIHLLTDEQAYNSYSEAMQKRIATYYRKSDVDDAYRELYTTLSERPTTPFEIDSALAEEEWPALASA